MVGYDDHIDAQVNRFFDIRPTDQTFQNDFSFPQLADRAELFFIELSGKDLIYELSQTFQIHVF